MTYLDDLCEFKNFHLNFSELCVNQEQDEVSHFRSVDHRMDISGNFEESQPAFLICNNQEIWEAFFEKPCVKFPQNANTRKNFVPVYLKASKPN